MNASTETILKKGYILIPKSLIEDFLKAGLGTEGYLEAWIRVLALVNYSDTEICVQGNRMICRRGETVYTYSHGKRWGEGAATPPATSSKPCLNPESWRPWRTPPES
ncbi:hypothetical protein M079_5029, partial [Bacteroides fragilis str. 3996 N(B) 6]